MPISPPNKQIKSFFDKIGTTVEIKNETLSKNFWATSAMMAPFYEILKVLSDWLTKRGIKEMKRKNILLLFLLHYQWTLSIIQKNI